MVTNEETPDVTSLPKSKESIPDCSTPLRSYQGLPKIDFRLAADKSCNSNVSINQKNASNLSSFQEVRNSCLNSASFCSNEISIQELEISNKTRYTDFLQLLLDGVPLPSGWNVSTTDNSIVFSIINLEGAYITKSFEIKNGEQNGDLRIYGKNMTTNSFVKQTLPEIRDVQSLFILLQTIDFLPLCSGISSRYLVEYFDSMVNPKGVKNIFTKAVHAPNCDIVMRSNRKPNKKNPQTVKMCNRCFIYRKSLMICASRNKQNSMESRHSFMSRAQLLQKLEENKKNYSNLMRRSKRVKTKLRSQLHKNGKILSDEDNIFFSAILEKQKETLPKNSFKKLFLEQQLAALRSKTKRLRRWDPKVLQFCIHLYRKSPAAYKSLSSSGILELPSKRTLYSHSSHIGLKSGFNNDSFQMAKRMLDAACLQDHQRYVSLILDEMKIKEDIIYKANTGELVGFSNLNDTGNDILKLKQQSIKGEIPEVATHVLQLMIRSVTGNFKFPVAYFPCKSMDSDDLHSIISEAIANLEFHDIKVIAVIADGASTNRKVFRNFVGNDGYKWKNIYACDEDRYVYFICDGPHLMKTGRNGFSNSNFHAMSKKLLKNGQFLLWTQLLSLYEADSQRPFRLVPKLTRDHLYLDSYSRMRVRLAAQVFSATVANALELEYGDQFSETVKFIRLMNKFFDLINSKNLKEGQMKRNPNLNPYCDPVDIRLEVKRKLIF